MPALHATDRNTARIVLNNLSGDGLQQLCLLVQQLQSKGTWLEDKTNAL